MPTYDMVCDTCGFEDEYFLSVMEYEKGVECELCLLPLRQRIAPVMTIGPMPSKPLTINQIGKSFESNAELRRYQQENPDVAFVEADSPRWRKKVDSVRELCEQNARREGFNDLEEKRKFQKELKAAKPAAPTSPVAPTQT